MTPTSSLFQAGIISQTIWWVALVILGANLHEFCHLVWGWLFNGDPFISNRTLVVITEIDYNSPEAMKDWQARVTGGFVFVFLIMTLVGFWFHWWDLIWFGLGGSMVSETDLMATRYPKTWKKFTKGEEITREDFS
jgi:hypothetical protein